MSELSERLAELPLQHKQALEWFGDRRGQVVSWPEPLNDLFLVQRAKGIHRPKAWAYTLSVRQSLGSPYADRQPVGAPNGAWTYEYFQEGTDPADRDKSYGNRGLMACLADGIPVGVLIQEQGKPNVRYRVWGVAKVLGWTGGHFQLQGYDAAGEMTDPVDPDFAYVAIPPVYVNVAESSPIDVEDARKRIDAQIVVRQGGREFRKSALKDFNGSCAISDWAVEAVLEAAHIVPYRGAQTDQADNALLLRADLHTLFDRELLHIDPETRRIKLAAPLKNGPYAAFEGQEVRLAEGVSATTFRSRLEQRIEQLKPKTD